MKAEWRIFADEYIISCNATQAYSKAYPDASVKTCGANGHELLKNTEIKAYIDARMAEKTSDRIMKQDEILSLLTSIARGEQTEQTAVLVGDGVQELVPKDTMVKDRIKALELLGKRYGTFAEKIVLDVDEDKKDALKNLANIAGQMK